MFLLLMVYKWTNRVVYSDGGSFLSYFKGVKMFATAGEVDV